MCVCVCVCACARACVCMCFCWWVGVRVCIKFKPVTARDFFSSSYESERRSHSVVKSDMNLQRVADTKLDNIIGNERLI